MALRLILDIMTKAHFQHESNCGIRSLLFSEDSLTPTQERLEDLRSEMKKLGVEAHWELVIDNWHMREKIHHHYSIKIEDILD